MRKPDARGLGRLPTAGGLMTRLACRRAQSAGIDVRPLLKKAGITPHQIENKDERFPVADQVRFLDLTAEALHDDLLGFHLGQTPDLREIGLLFYVAASSNTLSDALQRTARYSLLTNEGIALTYAEDGDVRIGLHYNGVSRHLDRHQVECFMTLLLRICRHLTGLATMSGRVRIAHHRAGPYSELEKFFGDNLKFGAAIDELSLQPAAKDLPVVSADPYLSKMLIRYCEEALARRSVRRGAFRPRVENEIVPLLPHGKARAGEVARRLGVSQRTLTRSLAAEELTFSGVLESLRTDLARRYLDDEALSISQIAWLLGYREVSAFTHAFKRWSGETPRHARLRAAS